MHDYILGVRFGEYHTFDDWGLYMSGPASASIPEPRTNFIDVPGRNGPVDLSTALTGDITFESREFSAPFYSLRSPEEWPAFYSKILNILQGREFDVYLDEDPGWHYHGRFWISGVKYDNFWEFDIEGNINPYKLKDEKTTVSHSLTTEDLAITLTCDRMPVIPTISVDAETMLTWGSNSYTVNSGDHIIPDIQLTEGENLLKAKTLSGTGNIIITYQEGSL